jgi:hypothetical protein
LSTTTSSQTRIESSAPCSWVEIKYPDISTFDRDEWLKIARILKKATLHSPDADIVSAMQDVRTGEAQLWCLVDEEEQLAGAIVTRVVEYMNGNTVLLLQLGATAGKSRLDHDCIRLIFEHLEGVGRMLGCGSVRIEGRMGWGRILRDYDEIGRIYEKKIQEVH